ncbi:MAG: DUF819 family protein [Gemmatimonadetes bacterium]|nr:MAG: DUF819 family protein [Gemmatimonadota bacterium]
MDNTTALITDPMAVFAYIAAALGIVFWASTLPNLKKFFRIIPPIILAYFVPTLSTTVGITPMASPAYDWMRAYLLPIALLLLMITVDLKAIMRLGPVALIMMLAGTVGIIVGGPIALGVFGAWLPEDAWKGFAALAGSWIGGTANMVAMAESVGTPDSLMGPVIVIDTVVGYGWMGLLLFFSAWQTRFDKWNNADRRGLEDAQRHLEGLQSDGKALDLPHLTMIMGLAFAGAVLGVWLGGMVPELGDPKIISHTTWTVLIVVTVGLMLSFTKVRNLEQYGASTVGFGALYLLVGSIGAQADLAAVLETPAFLLAGSLWIAIHVAILLGVARLIRAPLFFVAVGSMANVGGAASAPVVAGIYNPALAPVGVLMGIAGYILGIYGALVAAWLLAMVGG